MVIVSSVFCGESVVTHPAEARIAQRTKAITRMEGYFCHSITKLYFVIFHIILVAMMLRKHHELNHGMNIKK